MKPILLILSLLLLTISSQSQTSPTRIVSLAPSLTKSLYYLGAEEKLIGHTNYCFIANADNKQVVASAVKVNIEKVITLRPDLVLASTITDPETINLLKKAGIRTEVFPTPKSFHEICIQFEHLGAIVGKTEKASEIVADVRQKVDIIKATYTKEIKSDFFFQIGAKPLFTVLENTFMNDYITFSGGQNIAAGLKVGTLNREFVLMKNPDVIIIVNMGIVGDEEKKVWENYPQLSAVKNKKIFFIESDMASTPNPPDFLKTMEAIKSKLAE